MRGSRVQFPPSAPPLSRMTEQSFRNKPSQTKRKEAFWRGFGLFVGCVAVMLLVASLVFVVSQRLVQGPEQFSDEEYLESHYALEKGQGGWSKSEQSAPALFGPAPAAPQPVASPAAAAATQAPIMPQSSAPQDVTPALSGIADIEQKREKIAAVLRQYFAATTLEERLLHVRDAARVEPLMRTYHQREPLVAYRLRDLGWVVRVDEPGYRFGYVQAQFEDATPASLVVEETEDGRVVIDWECLVRYGELAWSDFQRMKPVRPTLMRLIASRPESAPANATTGEGQWLELRHPAEAGTILGYFDRQDPQFAGLLEQLQTGNWKDVPVTLRVCFPEPPALATSGGVQIASVEGKGWLILTGKRNG